MVFIYLCELFFMMKKALFIILFFMGFNLSYAQINEVGVFLGGSNYIGDIGKTTYIYPNSYAVGGIYKWNMHPQYSIRATYTYSKIKGDDIKSNNSYRQFRGLKFENSLHEFAAGIEYHFFKYSLSKIGYTHTPYIILEAAVANYSTVEYESTISGLLAIEKRTFNFSIPFGVGYKTKLARNVGIGIETSFRYTFNDKMDGYPQIVDGAEINYTNGNDWYVFTGITIVYGFGREGCYTGNHFF